MDVDGAAGMLPVPARG